MAAFLSLANALWLARGEESGRAPSWGALHDALVRFADGIDRGLGLTVRHAAALVRSRSLVLLGADGVMADVVVNKVGTGPLLHAAQRAGVPAFVLADASKWLPEGLAGVWRVREEAPEEIARPWNPTLRVHNRYFGTSPLPLVTGVVWEGGVARPADVRRRITRLPVSKGLVRLLKTAIP